ncbi:MAG TPA: flagellar hook-basal body complex protein FliE [Actinomycetota bacterium]|nr:flagellar hook-basal body complex protein FliE [Actinomycetota bacterium]
MGMQIPAIGSVSPIHSPFKATGASSVNGSNGSSFGDMIQKGLKSVSASENNADRMVQDMASGKPVQAADVMIATSKASLSVEMLVAIRDQGLNAYKEIMNMQV